MATDVTGAVISGSETRYTPCGEVRTGGTLPTDRGFTSQRRETTIGLSDYVARFYDPYIGKFVSPDSIVPGAGNPQAFNRFAYVFNNPLRFVDPTGHDALGPDWESEFRKNHGRAPNDENRQTRLFSITRSGPVSGKDVWTDADWAEFNRRGRNFWFRDDLTGRMSLADFANVIDRLARAYTDDEADQFVRAIALLYAGLPYNTQGARGAIEQGLGGPRIEVASCGGGRADPCHWVDHRSFGFSRRVTNDDREENTHHYAGHLLAGFYLIQGINNGATLGREVNQGRTERGNILAVDQADIEMGRVAGRHGDYLRAGLIKPSQLGTLIRGDLSR
jgi:RHS repeat-associated protein